MRQQRTRLVRLAAEEEGEEEAAVRRDFATVEAEEEEEAAAAALPSEGQRQQHAQRPRQGRQPMAEAAEAVGRELLDLETRLVVGWDKYKGDECFGET